MSSPQLQYHLYAPVLALIIIIRPPLIIYLFILFKIFACPFSFSSDNLFLSITTYFDLYTGFAETEGFFLLVRKDYHNFSHKISWTSVFKHTSLEFVLISSPITSSVNIVFLTLHAIFYAYCINTCAPNRPPFIKFFLYIPHSLLIYSTRFIVTSSTICASSIKSSTIYYFPYQPISTLYDNGRMSVPAKKHTQQSVW